MTFTQYRCTVLLSLLVCCASGSFFILKTRLKSFKPDPQGDLRWLVNSVLFSAIDGQWTNYFRSLNELR